MQKTKREIKLSELKKALMKRPVEKRKELIDRALRWRQFKLIQGGKS